MNGVCALTICALVTLLSGCRAESAEISGESIGALVTNLVKQADASETALLASVLQPGDKVTEVSSLMPMIQRSGMLTNYLERLEQHSTTNARLNYHWLERHCHFQVELANTGALWRVTRIGYCR